MIKKGGVPTHQPQSHHYIPAGQWDFYFFYHLQHMYSFPTYRKPLASMLTGQGLLPLAPSIQAQKWLRKNSKKTWIQIYNQRINQWKPEAYKLT